MKRSPVYENPPPVIGAPDREKPEDTKARLYQQHKVRGTLGVFYQLYPPPARTADESQMRKEIGKAEAAREALQRHIEAPERGTRLEARDRPRGIER